MLCLFPWTFVLSSNLIHLSHPAAISPVKSTWNFRESFIFSLCMGAIHKYISVNVEIAYSTPHCSSLSHLVFPSLDNHRPKKRHLHDQKVEILAQYKQGATQAMSTSHFIEKKSVCVPPYITSHYWSSLISFQLLSLWLVIYEQKITCSSQTEHSRGRDAEWQVRV